MKDLIVNPIYVGIVFFGAIVGTAQAQKLELVTQSGNYSIVEQVEFSPDSRILASLGGQYIKLLDIASGKELRTFEKSNSTRVFGMAFSPDGKYIAGLQNDIEIWNVETGENLKSCNITSPETLAFSGGGLFAAATDNTVELCNFKTGKRGPPLQKRLAAVEGVVFDAETEDLISLDHGTVRRWNSKTGQQLHQFSVDNPEGLRPIFSHDGKKLAIANNGQPVQIWDLNIGKLIRQLDNSENAAKGSFVSNDNYFAAVTVNDRIVFWNLKSGEQTQKAAVNITKDTANDFEEDAACSISSDGRLFAIGTNDSRVKLLNVETGNEIYTFERYSVPIQAFAFSPSGKIMAVAQGGVFSSMSTVNTEVAIKLWNLSENREIKILRKEKPLSGKEPSQVLLLILSADDKTIASLTTESITIWNTETGQNIREIEFPGQQGSPDFILFSPDNEDIAGLFFAHEVQEDEGATTQVRDIKLWNIKKGSEIPVPKTRPKWLQVGNNALKERFRLNYLGQTFEGVGDPQKIKLLNTPKQKEIASFVFLGDFDWVVATPDGRFDTNKSLDSIDGVHWVVSGDGLTPLPLEIFMRQYYEPDLLRRVLKCNADNTCDKEFKPLPPIGQINRVQPGLGKPAVSDPKEKL